MIGLEIAIFEARTTKGKIEWTFEATVTTAKKHYHLQSQIGYETQELVSQAAKAFGLALGAAIMADDAKLMNEALEKWGMLPIPCGETANVEYAPKQERHLKVVH